MAMRGVNKDIEEKIIDMYAVKMMSTPEIALAIHNLSKRLRNEKGQFTGETL